MPPHRGAAPFVDGRITNPHNKAKQNEQLHEPQAYQKSSQLLLQAFGRSEEFREFAFPVAIAPPLITRYQPGDAIRRARRRRLHPAADRRDPQRSQLHDLPQRSEGL